MKRITFLATLTLICSITAYPQGRTRPAPRPTQTVKAEQPTRKVIVNLKTGESVTGNLLRADPATVEIQVAGSALTIKLDDIASLVFDPSAAAAPKPARSSTDYAAALRSLRKLEGATEVGINFQEYGRRLVDVKAEVDEALRGAPEGGATIEIRSALQAYVDAGQAWGELQQRRSRYPSLFPDNDAMADALQKKYSIPTETVNTSGGSIPPFRAMSQNVVLSTIWKAAKNHIQQAENLINQK
jgi:hypothetical protein